MLRGVPIQLYTAFNQRLQVRHLCSTREASRILASEHGIGARSQPIALLSSRQWQNGQASVQPMLLHQITVPQHSVHTVSHSPPQSLTQGLWLPQSLYQFASTVTNVSDKRGFVCTIRVADVF